MYITVQVKKIVILDEGNRGGCGHEERTHLTKQREETNTRCVGEKIQAEAEREILEPRGANSV